MPYAFPPDVQQLIAQRMASGCYANEDDVLRDALRVLQEVDDDAAAIQIAIDEWPNIAKSSCRFASCFLADDRMFFASSFSSTGRLFVCCESVAGSRDNHEGRQFIQGG